MSFSENGSLEQSPLQKKLLFAITEHEALGMLIEGFVVEITRFRQFSLSSRKVNRHTVKDYALTCSDYETELLELIEQYSDEEIIKRFGRRYSKPAEFFGSLSQEMLKENIRPYIERRLTRILLLLGENKAELYRKGKRREPVDEHPLVIESVPAEVVFHFHRGENGTDYHLTVRSKGEELLLTGKSWRIFTSKPCWILAEDRLIAVDPKVDGYKLLPFFTKESIHIPVQAERKYFETFVLNAVRSFTMMHSGFSIQEESQFSEVFLQPEIHLNGTPVFGLYFDYKFLQVSYKELLPVLVKFQNNGGNYRFIRVRRNLPQEEFFASWLREHGLEECEGKAWKLKQDLQVQQGFSISELIVWLNIHAEELADAGINVRQGFLKEKYFTGIIRLSFEVQESNDWFDLLANVHFGAIVVPFIRLRENILSGNREFLLPNGEIAILPEEWFSRYREIIKFGHAGEETIRLRKCHAGLLEGTGYSGKVTILEKLKNAVDSFSLEEIRMPEGMEARLRPYQIKGYQWLRLLQKSGLGGCLADDMGLGKTLQTLAILADQKTMKQPLRVLEFPKGPGIQLDLFQMGQPVKEAEASTSLIVMPLSLIWNWESEIRKFTPGLKVYKHIGQNRTTQAEDFYRYDIVLTTYGIVRNDLELLKKFEFRYVVLDESQMIKNSFSKLFKAVRQLRSKHRLLLTGTPIENSLSDLWSQMTFLNEGILGSLSFFKEEFLVPIEKYRDEVKEKKLRDIIAPFILRRTKEMVAPELPSLTEQVYYCEMNEDQRTLYETRKSEIRNFLIENITKNGIEKSRFVILKGLMELRLLANHPCLVPWGKGHTSGKYEEVIRSVENILSEGHKVLIFSSFVRHLNVFADAFRGNGWKYAMLTGQMQTGERMHSVHQFQKQEEIRLFLMTLKAGGVGINLTAADYVFILDPWWNPATENQAIARAHRIGQEKKVIAYKFITRDTIEEKILNLQHRKSDLADLFIQRNDPFPFFTQETIVQLTE